MNNNIRSHKCDTCGESIKVNICNNKKDLYYFFCCNCLKSVNVCSKQNCSKLFLLNNDDLANLKIIYLFGNNSKFYIYDDIKSIIITKYGNFDNLKKLLKDKKEMKKKKLEKIANEKLEREKQLKELFMLNKLEYKNHGDCYSYIHYGTPALNVVLNNELNKLNEQTNRQMILANRLNDFNIPLDEKLKSCYEYINNLNTKPLDDIITSIKIEYNLKNNNDNFYNNEIYVDNFENYNICV
jgi:hypothetical protein